MKISHYVFFILLALSANCLAFSESKFFLNKSNSADYVVIARKISGYLDCEYYLGSRLNSYGKLCDDKIFSDNVRAYNATKQNEEFVVLSTVFGKKTPGEVLNFKVGDWDLRPTSVGQDYLMFIYDRAGVLYFEPCAIFEYQVLKDILDQKPSIETLFNKLKENPNGSCMASPPNPTVKSRHPKKD